MEHKHVTYVKEENVFKICQRKIQKNPQHITSRQNEHRHKEEDSTEGCSQRDTCYEMEMWRSRAPDESRQMDTVATGWILGSKRGKEKLRGTEDSLGRRLQKETWTREAGNRGKWKILTPQKHLELWTNFPGMD